VQLRLVEDHPAARASATVIERPEEQRTERRRGSCVPWCRTGRRVQLIINDLSDEMIRKGDEVGIGRRVIERGKVTKRFRELANRVLERFDPAFRELAK
jgi:hypothetical protein